MTKPSHTPGPVTVHEDDDGNYWLSPARAKGPDGTLWYADKLAERIGNKADAMLYAAAPALLEAAKYCAQFGPESINPTLVKRLTVVIAAAEGK